MFKRTMKRAFRAVGLEVAQYRPSAADVLERMLRRYRVDSVFDIGANTGQSGEHFRFIGYAGDIVSFEPIEHLFLRLQARAAFDPRWHCEKLALGKFPGKAHIHVSGGHAGASSLLEPTENVRRNAPEQQTVTSELVEIATLDDVLAKHYPSGNRCFLKIDVQGYEKAVLEGGLRSLHRVIGLKIELSLVENYKGETLLPEMLPFLYGLGFRLLAFESGWSNAHSGELYQVDGILFRTNGP